jgi:hypothetical protein
MSLTAKVSELKGRSEEEEVGGKMNFSMNAPQSEAVSMSVAKFLFQVFNHPQMITKVLLHLFCFD